MTIANGVPGSEYQEIDKSAVIGTADEVSASTVLKSSKGRINIPLTFSTKADFINEFGIPYFSGDSKVPEYGYGLYAGLKWLEISSKLTAVRVPSVGDVYSEAGFQLNPATNTLASLYGSGVTPPTNSPVVPNTINNIQELESATAITNSNFTIYPTAPGEHGNNLAFSVEFFGKDCDWQYDYDDADAIDDIIFKASNNALAAADIEPLIAPKVFKLSFYSKTSLESWPAVVDLDNPITADRVLYVSLSNILDLDNNSLYIKDVMDKYTDYYVTTNTPVTNDDLAGIINKAFNGDTLVNSIVEFKDTTNDFVCMDTNFAYVAEGSLVPDSFYFIAKPISELADSTDLAGTVNNTNVEKYKTLGSNQYLKYKMQTDGTEGFYVNDAGDQYTLNVNHNLENVNDQTLLTDENNDAIVLPFFELEIQSDTDLRGLFNFTDLRNGASATVGVGTSDLNNTDGWDYLANRQLVDSTIVLVPSNKTGVKQHVESSVIAERLDSVMEAQSGAVEDLTADAIITAEDYGYSNPSYVSLTAGYTKVKDTYNDKFVWLPNAIFTAYTDAKTAIQANIWDSPAGNPRGIISGIEQNVVFNDGDLSKLFKANINAAKQFKGIGAVIWESLTAQRNKTALRSKNVRFTMNQIETVLGDYTNELVHNINNTDVERQRVEDHIDAYMNDIKIAGGVNDYKVQCDSKNNTDAVIDNEQLIIWVFIKPTRNVKFIKLDFVVTSQSASFDEIQL